MKKTLNTQNNNIMSNKNVNKKDVGKVGVKKGGNIFSLLGADDSDDDNKSIESVGSVDKNNNLKKTESAPKESHVEQEPSETKKPFGSNGMKYSDIVSKPPEKTFLQDRLSHEQTTRSFPTISSSNNNDFSNYESNRQGRKKTFTTSEGDGWMSTKKRDNVRSDIPEKDVYDEKADTSIDYGNDKVLNSYWTVWVHKTTDQDWTLKSYQKIFTINSIGSFWRFFNNFIAFNKTDYHIFIMREDVAPIWEDVNNKFGGICSLKVDSLQKGYKTDISTEIFVTLAMLLTNETLMKDNKSLNGISYSVKKRSVFIKLWHRLYNPDRSLEQDLPKLLLKRYGTELEHMGAGRAFANAKYGNQTSDLGISVQYKQIKPEYDL